MHMMVLLPSTSTSTSISFRRLLPTVGRCSTAATAIVVHRHHRHHRGRYHDAGDCYYPPSPPPPSRHSARSFVAATPPPPSASASAGPSSGGGGEVFGASAAPALPDVVATTTRATTTTTTTIGLRPRVVILGTGWAGFTLARKLDKSLYDIRVVSPANHFLFTPLLPSTAVGTLEFRAIQEPVRTIDGLDKYYQAKATDIDLGGRYVKCEDLYSGAKFDVPYDYLCVAGGMKSNTFHVQRGVSE